MALTGEQVKGRIKNLAKIHKADARVLMRIYMMERFLERMAASDYKENFIIKGGILVTSMLGVSMRSTMDIDTSIQNLKLSEKEALDIISEIVDIDLHDGVIFNAKNVSIIMDEMEYPGIRISIDAILDGLVTAIKLDISTGDAITPRAIEYDYKLMFENRSIKLWSYNLETILAEKIQTILARSILNTRMRDFYDVYSLSSCYESNINPSIFRQAFISTCNQRKTIELLTVGNESMELLKKDTTLNNLWNAYQNKYDYAREIKFEDAIDRVIRIYDMIK
jgi:putative abortive infection protein abiGII